MSTIMPQNEQTRKAVVWMSEAIAEENEKKFEVLLEEAAVRFNLSPKDVDFLQRFYLEKQG